MGRFFSVSSLPTTAIKHRCLQTIVELGAGGGVLPTLPIPLQKRCAEASPLPRWWLFGDLMGHMARDSHATLCWLADLMRRPRGDQPGPRNPGARKALHISIVVDIARSGEHTPQDYLLVPSPSPGVANVASFSPQDSQRCYVILPVPCPLFAPRRVNGPSLHDWKLRAPCAIPSSRPQRSISCRDQRHGVSPAWPAPTAFFSCRFPNPPLHRPGSELERA